ncbi:hypothetical protein F5148DRAFT_1150804 [Russula earlei]|uniref:Uncharacterized protein n=1 Tax=Russula earlei TaxID=71964 RepID=A0ACC0U2P5_9AGAM|nr:hypothetical protein F5148DRAFT_1150804 [Russula earlei]
MTTRAIAVLNIFDNFCPHLTLEPLVPSLLVPDTHPALGLLHPQVVKAFRTDNTWHKAHGHPLTWDIPDSNFTSTSTSVDGTTTHNGAALPPYIASIHCLCPSPHPRIAIQFMLDHSLVTQVKQQQEAHEVMKIAIQFMLDHSLVTQVKQQQEAHEVTKIVCPASSTPTSQLTHPSVIPEIVINPVTGPASVPTTMMVLALTLRSPTKWEGWLTCRHDRWAKVACAGMWSSMTCIELQAACCAWMDKICALIKKLGELLCFHLQPSGCEQELMREFFTARQVSGHPVVLSNWGCLI